MNIGLDIDGVLYPWHESLYRHFIEYKNFDGSLREFWKYFINQPEHVQAYYISIPTLYMDTTPRDDVLEFVPKLAELGTIYYITSRAPELELVTQKFLDKFNFPFKENLILTTNKSIYIRLHNIEYYLDDNPKYVDGVKNLTIAFLFKACHNWEERDNYPLINTIKEFYEMLKEKHGQSSG